MRAEQAQSAEDERAVRPRNLHAILRDATQAGRIDSATRQAILDQLALDLKKASVSA